jgi:Response regulator containing CheY-like receiver, AAA-type ATPase, and DNA-binding domains
MWRRSMAKILIIDDSAIPRMVLRKMLEKSGHHVLDAADGASAITRYRSEIPDLAVLDLMLKDESGLEVLAQIRRVDPGAHVIVATGETTETARQSALEAGAGAFISKPFAAEEVLGAINALLEQPARSVLQLDRLRDACMDDADTERVFLRRLVTTAPEMLAQIRSALAARDGAKVDADAHTLKGGCYMLGADALGAACERLERTARDGDLGPAEVLLAQAEREMGRLRQAVDTYLNVQGG